METGMACASLLHIHSFVLHPRVLCAASQWDSHMENSSLLRVAVGWVQETSKLSFTGVFWLAPSTLPIRSICLLTGSSQRIFVSKTRSSAEALKCLQPEPISGPNTAFLAVPRSLWSLLFSAHVCFIPLLRLASSPLIDTPCPLLLGTSSSSAHSHLTVPVRL